MENEVVNVFVLSFHPKKRGVLAVSVTGVFLRNRIVGPASNPLPGSLPADGLWG